MTQTSANRRHREGGFSLLEILTSMVVLTILIAALFTFYRSQALALSQQERFINVKQNAQIGLDFMIRELRTAGSRPLPESFDDPTCAANVSTATNCFGIRFGTTPVKGFPSFVSASGTGLRFLADRQGNAIGSIADGCPDDPNEDVEYTYDAGSGQLRRTAGGTTSVVLDGIPANGFRLRYYRVQGASFQEMQSGGGALTANEIASISHLAVTVRAQATSRVPGMGPIHSDQTATIQIRSPAC